MMMAKMVALRSNCNSRPNGAVIVFNKRILATGYNGSLPGSNQCSDKGSNYCYRRTVKGKEQDKYNICPSIHAEANAIAQAAQFNISVSGADIYCTLSPCLVCAKLLKASGINKVYYELEYKSSDEQRDRMWMGFNKKELFVERVSIHSDTRDLFANNCNVITSIRRL